MARFEPQQFGKYFLLEKLAVGGMAEIYKAKTYGAEGFEKLLAIKRILPHAAEDKEFINMLIDEAKLSVLLSHANIVQVFDLGKIGSDYFISMEYIHGVNIRDVLYKLRERGEKIPAELAVFIASEICKGLDYAHRKTDAEGNPLGIVHRDISPQNILISYEGEVKIVDFGIAKAAMNISHTMAGILKGKIAYMSPEQAMGKTIDNRTDIFSLGILLYEAVTGKKLFTGESQFEVLKKIRTTRIRPEGLPDSLATEMKTILSKALAYDPQERYQQASDMSVALTRFLYGTYTDFSPRKLSAFIRKHFPPEEKELPSDTAKQTLIEGMTGSVSARSGAGKPPVEKNIVHRPTKTDVLAQRTGSETLARPKPPVSALLLLFGVLSLTVTGIVGWFFWTSSPPEARPIITVSGGTLQIGSEPAGADIALNGKPTGLKTPAILDNLTLNQKQTLTLTLAEHASQEETVTLRNGDPMSLHLTLQQEFGILSIISDPEGAAILVNDIAIGKSTPAKIEDLSLNKEYRIVLSKPGFEDFEQTITLLNVQPQKMLTVMKPIEKQAPPEPVEPATPAITTTTEPTLSAPAVPTPVVATPTAEKPKPAAPEPVKPAPKPKSEPKKVTKPKVSEPKEVPPPPEEKQAGGTGQIQITSEPSGAEVFLDGDYQGVTPITLSREAGKVKVLVTKGTDLLPCSRPVTVKANQQENVRCNLGPLYGEVILNSDPPRADVSLNGKKLGKTPITIRKVKRTQTHTITVERGGFKPWSSTFDMESTTKKSFDIKLEKE